MRVRYKVNIAESFLNVYYNIFQDNTPLDSDAASPYLAGGGTHYNAYPPTVEIVKTFEVICRILVKFPRVL